MVVHGNFFETTLPFGFACFCVSICLQFLISMHFAIELNLCWAYIANLNSCRTVVQVAPEVLSSRMTPI